MELILAPGRVLLTKVEEERKTGTGLFLPNVGKTGMKKGKVISTGEPLKDKPMRVKSGDVVYYQYGIDVAIDGKDYQLINHDEWLFLERP